MDDKDIALGREAFERGRDYEIYCVRHSTAHIMAHAVQEIFPDASFAIGPPIEDGFYYDFELPRPLTPEDLVDIEGRMRAIISRDLPFAREMWSKEKAREWFGARKQRFKIELIEGIADPEVSIYTVGSFTDLCRGPHVVSAGACPHFKLLSVTGAYWRGNEKNPMLQRIYGTAWLTAEDLQGYIVRREEAKRRDHRKLGKELGLVMFDDMAPGSAFWLPRGTLLYRTLSEKMRNLVLKNGYVEVQTPLIFKKDLWEISGHWAHYRENMFLIEDDDQIYSLKPMNCPSHMLIFGSQVRSYRELPLRIHDQGVLHRNERSGALSGLTRVRQFRQDDAHIFLAEEMVEDEVSRLIDLVDRVYGAFGMSLRRVLSTRPEKAMGDPALWTRAEAALRRILDQRGSYEVAEGEGAFYGPKIDHMVRDSIGREHQLATIQLDFQLPRNFGLEYVTAQNTRDVPVVIHRAIYGSIERFVAILIEHYAGAFPVWLAPEQVRVLPISEKTEAYAREVTASFEKAGVRVESDVSGERIGAKIRLAEAARVPYMAVIGKREAETRSVSLRSRSDGDLGVMPLDEVVGRVAREAAFEF